MPESSSKAMTSSTSSLPVPIRGGGGGGGQRSGGTANAPAQEKLSPAETRLKMQLDDCERRRKNLVIQSQKVTRENEAIQRKYKQILSEHEAIKKSYVSTNEELAQLKRVSEAVYKEYEKLLQRFDVETGAMHKAMQKATGWYKQNRALKRQSAILVQKFLQVSPDSITELDESSSPEIPEKDDDELDDLRRSVKELSSENTRLQVELNAVRLEEFEAQEQLIDSTTKMETERMARLRAEEELAELKSRNDTLGRLASLEAEELVALRERLEHERVTTTQMRREADQAKKERNVLAHQSTLLLADVVGDERLHMLVMEVENLKARLEDHDNKHNAQVHELQNKIFELQSESRIEVLEEKLKLTECELECEQQRATRAESRLHELEAKVVQLQEDHGNISEDGGAPPPPPPLPPPPPAFRDIPLPQQHPVTEMATMLGLKQVKQEKKLQKAASLQGGAIDEIIDQIKGGRFTLKATEQRQRGRTEEQPAAVQEMLQILGTMKRGTRRQPFTASTQ